MPPPLERRRAVDVRSVPAAGATSLSGRQVRAAGPAPRAHDAGRALFSRPALERVRATT